MIRGIEYDVHDQLFVIGTILFWELLGAHTTAEIDDSVEVVRDICREDHLNDYLPDIPVLSLA